MARGHHLIADRGMYEHHAIDRGDGTVVELAGKREGGQVRIAPLWEFCCGDPVRIRSHRGPRYSRLATAQRAEAFIGQGGYSLIHRNCEHFANWAATGQPRSLQIERVKRAVVIGGVCGLALMQCRRNH